RPPPLHADEAPQQTGGTSQDRKDRLPLDPLIPESASALIEEGKRVADDLVDRFRQSPDAHEMLARFHYEFGQVERAVQAWQQCLELDPSYAYAHAGLAKAATRRGAHGEAVSHLRQAILVQPQVVSYQI